MKNLNSTHLVWGLLMLAPMMTFYAVAGLTLEGDGHGSSLNFELWMLITVWKEMTNRNTLNLELPW